MSMREPQRDVITFPAFIARAIAGDEKRSEAIITGANLKRVVRIYGRPFNSKSPAWELPEFIPEDREFFVAVGLEMATRAWSIHVRQQIGHTDIGTYTTHVPAAPLEHVRLGLREWAKDRPRWRWLLRLVREPRMKRVEVTWREVFPSATLHPELGPSFVALEIVCKPTAEEELRP